LDAGAAFFLGLLADGAARASLAPESPATSSAALAGLPTLAVDVGCGVEVSGARAGVTALSLLRSPILTCSLGEDRAFAFDLASVAKVAPAVGSCAAPLASTA